MGVHSSIKNISRSYRLEIIDREFGDNHLIITIGSGMLMAAMDAMPRARYAIEYRKGMDIDAFGLLSFYIKKVIVVAWFSISKPNDLIKILDCFYTENIFYYSNKILVGQRFESFMDLVSIINTLNINNTLTIKEGFTNDRFFNT